MVDTPTDAERLDESGLAAAIWGILARHGVPCRHKPPGMKPVNQYRVLQDIEALLTHHRDARLDHRDARLAELEAEVEAGLDANQRNMLLSRARLREEGRRAGLREVWEEWQNVAADLASLADFGRCLERAAEGATVATDTPTDAERALEFLRKGIYGHAIRSLDARIAELEVLEAQMVALIAESDGVAGLHLNGDDASWSWLISNDWLSALAVKAKPAAEGNDDGN